MTWKRSIDHWTRNLIVRSLTRGTSIKRPSSRSEKAVKNIVRQPKQSVRHSIVESLESRVLFNVDPLWVGGVYVEEDNGGDSHGDSFYVTFRGGAAGTQLTRLVIDTDQGSAGFSSGDNLFDTVEGGLGSDTYYWKLGDGNDQISNENLEGFPSLLNCWYLVKYCFVCPLG